MKVFVYRNLNRKGVVYSLKAMEGEYKGKVLGYATCLLIESPSFIVSEKGRQRVLLNKRKNVHAGVVGNVLAVYQYVPRHLDLPDYYNDPLHWQNIHVIAMPITYNPYKKPTFYVRKTGNAIFATDVASFMLTDVRAVSW